VQWDTGLAHNQPPCRAHQDLMEGKIYVSWLRADRTSARVQRIRQGRRPRLCKRQDPAFGTADHFGVESDGSG
jgi:hypothetical protein